MKKIETVRYIYERFARGDAPAILAIFDERIEFRLAQGHPYQPEGKPWIGGQAITDNFFNRAGAEWQDWTFHIDAVVEGADTLVVEGRYAALYKPTGRVLDAQGCHVWRFRNGRIVSFHQYVDTAHVQDVMDMRRSRLHEAPSPRPASRDAA
jgi:ketosteroid isomerase-like protein